MPTDSIFVDRAKIFVKAGDGGNGCIAFRREKFVPRGGPSGGNGGRGGHVVFRSNPHLNTLLAFRFKQHYRAQRGRHGSGNNKTGRSGQDLYVEVPVGTVVIDAETKEALFDFAEAGLEQVVALGGKGGRGNASFSSSVNQAPRVCGPGETGQERVLLLELKVLADVGLIGFPNAGKSTLISALSSARPRIADYPFTTLSPHLGVVSLGEYHTATIADIPGLIRGAHRGSGLGHHFLRHIERCRVLVHMIDVSSYGEEDPVEAMNTINHELRLYHHTLGEKPQLIVASKMDAVDLERLQCLENHCRRKKIGLLRISSVTGRGLSSLKLLLAEQLKQEVELEDRNTGRDV